ncbi:hypothetical protein [Mammaliicoccus sp. P-M59]|uniref:hypothetical protein n=1 Tax=Mammaliicoccus sp. P-M59 TaxID=2898718 RepID=UPI001EFAB9AB|nr:hypothetical protein [Mammaliicoccus sp. P-M59]
MKKILTVIGLLVVTLAGCGKATEEKEVKFSDVMNDKKETISYIVKNNSEDSPGIGKDSEILRYIISKNGKVAVFNDDNSENPSNTRLGKLLKMSDDEKIKFIKKRDKDSFNKSKSELAAEKMERVKQAEKDLEQEGDSDERIEEMNGKTPKEFYTKQIKTFTKDAKKIKNTKYKEPTFEKLVIEISTDETGNNTNKEFLNIASHDFDEESKNGVYRNSKESAKNYGFYFTDVVSPIEIYDTKVAGINNIKYIEDNSSYDNYDTVDYDNYKYLVTEVGDKTQKFKLDQPDDKGVKEK